MHALFFCNIVLEAERAYLDHLTNISDFCRAELRPTDLQEKVTLPDKISMSSSLKKFNSVAKFNN